MLDLVIMIFAVAILHFVILVSTSRAFTEMFDEDSKHSVGGRLLVCFLVFSGIVVLSCTSIVSSYKMGVQDYIDKKVTVVESKNVELKW